jgi:hypothetical protein
VAIGLRKSFDADAYVSPCDDSAGRILQSGRRAGALPRIDPAYNRFSRAWDAIAEYANDQRELCDISSLSLNGFEKEQREAVKMRDNACAGRPVRPFPADIIQR